MAKAKTWIEKRDCGKAPHVKTIDKAFTGMPAGCKMLISSPQEIEEFIKRIPKGEFVEPAKMRQALAKKHKADATCPVTTGLFLRIVAEAAFEEFSQGKAVNKLTPFWRVIANDSALAKKLSTDTGQLEYFKKLTG